MSLAPATPPARSHPAGRPAAIALATFAVGLALTVFLQARQQASEQARLEGRIRAAVEFRVRALQSAARTYEGALNALRTLFTFSDEVSEEEFNGAARDLIERHPGIGALEWAPLVPHAERAATEARLRTPERPDFVFRDRLAPQIIDTSPVQDTYLPILYIEPLEPNRPALGLNLLSGRSHAEVKLALSTGQTAMSRQSRLLVDGETTMGFIVYVPVYDSLPLPSSRTPPDVIKGMVLGAFRLDRFFSSAAELNTSGFDFLVNDVTARSPDGVVAVHYDSLTTETANLPSVESFLTPHALRVPIRLWERDWELIYRPTAAWLAGATSRQPYVLLIIGSLASAALGLLLFFRLRHMALIQRLVEERTAELRASREELAAIMDNSPNVIFMKDLEGRYLVANRRFEELYGGGRPTVVGCTDADLFPPEYAATYRRSDAAAIASGRTETFEEVTVVDGRPMTSIVFKFPLRDASGAIRAVGGITTDITGRKQAETERLAMERKLLESQKLESLGVLAGGIAHDFNNLLTGIMGNASLLNYELPRGSPLGPHLRQIESAALRAAELCQQMLAYSGKGRFMVGPMNLSALVQETVPLLRASIGKSVRLQFQLDEALPSVMADATQMRQILMNLVINASDAIGERTGDIVLATGTQYADAALLKRAEQGSTSQAGNYVFLEVRDTGCGMSPETKARIFDPFFTTKFAGRGLGLAAVLGIVRGHQGALLVDSTVGEGSTFRLLLPASDVIVEASRLPTPSGRDAPETWRTHGRVLLVDDEDAVRFVGSHMLASFNLTVDTAADGPEALARFDAPGVHYDLVLLDLTMPGMGGEQVLRELRARRADVRVVLMSGYSEQEVSQRFTGAAPTAFIQKPFSVASVRAKLQEILGDPVA